MAVQTVTNLKPSCAAILGSESSLESLDHTVRLVPSGVSIGFVRYSVWLQPEAGANQMDSKN